MPSMGDHDYQPATPISRSSSRRIETRSRSRKIRARNAAQLLTPPSGINFGEPGQPLIKPRIINQYGKRRSFPVHLVSPTDTEVNPRISTSSTRDKKRNFQSLLTSTPTGLVDDGASSHSGSSSAFDEESEHFLASARAGLNINGGASNFSAPSSSKHSRTQSFMSTRTSTINNEKSPFPLIPSTSTSVQDDTVETLASHHLATIYHFADAREDGLAIIEKNISLKEKEIKRQEDQLAEKERQLIKIADTFKSASVCHVCYGHMLKPFVIRECGHTFCGPCLQHWFSNDVEKRLKRLACLKFYKTEQHSAQSAPKSQKHLDFTVKALRREGKDPEIIFRYHCPLCRVIVKNSPVDCVVAREMLSGVARALEGRFDLLPCPTAVSDESSVTETGFFNGLFLDIYDPSNYHGFQDPTAPNI